MEDLRENFVKDNFSRGFLTVGFQTGIFDQGILNGGILDGGFWTGGFWTEGFYIGGFWTRKSLIWRDFGPGDFDCGDSGRGILGVNPLINRTTYCYHEFYIGCHCWFDPLEKYVAKNTCACCKNDGVQCGYPKHAWCQPKVNEGIIQEGCAGERK